MSLKMQLIRFKYLKVSYEPVHRKHDNSFLQYCTRRNFSFYQYSNHNVWLLEEKQSYLYFSWRECN